MTLDDVYPIDWVDTQDVAIMAPAAEGWWHGRGRVAGSAVIVRIPFENKEAAQTFLADLDRGHLQGAKVGAQPRGA